MYLREDELMATKSLIVCKIGEAIKLGERERGREERVRESQGRRGEWVGGREGGKETSSLYNLSKMTLPLHSPDFIKSSFAFSLSLSRRPHPDTPTRDPRPPPPPRHPGSTSVSSRRGCHVLQANAL